MKYSLEFRPSVLKSLRRFPKRDLVRLKNKRISKQFALHKDHQDERRQSFS
jgi:mRNA-degrading endonuclease RelE of RelBE toxin-antitoxin system